MMRELFSQFGINFPLSSSTNHLGLDRAGGLSSPNNVSGPPPAAATKTLLFNERTGIILAHATREEFDVIEQAVQVLNYTPPLVNLDVKLVEITGPVSKALGFDWFLGTAVITNTPAPKTNVSGTLRVFPGIPPEAPSDDGKQKANPPVATVTGVLTDPQLQAAVRALEQKVSNLGKATNSANQAQPTNRPAGTLTGVLTDTQFRALLRALEQRSGVDVLSMPSVTTLSGRQALVEVSESKTVVFGVDTNRGPDVLLTKNIPLGPSVDIIPYVSSDGQSIQMTIVANVTEFLGYDDPGPFRASDGLGPLTTVSPMPKFRIRELTSKATVWDGQTLVLSGFIPVSPANSTNKFPVLGDLPMLGRLFSTETNSLRNKQLILFITPTIIDPAGNPVHTEGNRRFDPNTVPAQPPQK